MPNGAYDGVGDRDLAAPSYLIHSVQKACCIQSLGGGRKFFFVQIVRPKFKDGINERHQ